MSFAVPRSWTRVPAQEVGDRLPVTKGNVSVAVRSWSNWEWFVAPRPKGDHRTLAADTEFWRIAHMVVRVWPKPEFDQSVFVVQRCAGRASGGTDAAVLQRLRLLKDFCACWTVRWGRC